MNSKIEKEIDDAMQELAQVVTELKTERDMLRKENEYLKSLVNHLASRPAPYQPDPYAPPYKVTC